MPKALGSQTLSCANAKWFMVRLVVYPGPSCGCAEAGEGGESSEQSWELSIGPDPGVGCAAMFWTWKVVCGEES